MFSVSACSTKRKTDDDDTKTQTTLKSLGKEYEDELILQAKINAGTEDGVFKVVVLGADETIENIQNYNFSPSINQDEIIKGLFVEYGVLDGNGDVLYCIYYNFGLQFSRKQTQSVTVNYGGWGDTWTLDVVEDNKTILFEYSIT